MPFWGYPQSRIALSPKRYKLPPTQQLLGYRVPEGGRSEEGLAATGETRSRESTNYYSPTPAPSRNVCIIVMISFISNLEN